MIKVSNEKIETLMWLKQHNCINRCTHKHGTLEVIWTKFSVVTKVSWLGYFSHHCILRCTTKWIAFRPQVGNSHYLYILRFWVKRQIKKNPPFQNIQHKLHGWLHQINPLLTSIRTETKTLNIWITKTVANVWTQSKIIFTGIKGCKWISRIIRYWILQYAPHYSCYNPFASFFKHIKQYWLYHNSTCIQLVSWYIGI